MKQIPNQASSLAGSLRAVGTLQPIAKGNPGQETVPFYNHQLALHWPTLITALVNM